MNKHYFAPISKQHKIRNVSKEVCTCEQMVAYNICFSYADCLQNMYDGCYSAIAKDKAKNEWMQKFVLTLNTKYNLDAIYHIVKNNIDKYIAANKPIFADYKEVGKMFECLYKIV